MIENEQRYTHDEELQASNHTIWTEKYRPKKFSEVLGQDEIVKRVEAFVKQKNMPHVLFSGPAGVGKTSLALVIARQLFGNSYHMNFLELNASDERGIDVVRNKVKDFARTRSIGDVPFKIIYLDECDALTREAQQALRRTMENFTQTTRFILSANYSSKIIDPIQSRCAIFRFKPLAKEDIFKLIDKIAAQEGIRIDSAAKEALYVISQGDCRRVENILQSAASMEKHISEESVFSLASMARPKEVKEVLELALKNKFVDARNKLLNIMLDYGLSGIDVIKQIQSEIISLDISGKHRMVLMEKCGEVEFRMTEGSDEFLQLESFLAQVALVGMQ
ncbi:replication factor C small subunit [Candidatus Woesearchaeota archaeon]|nr:replication factor C small subunit [Candidatus Woesearchaeota archaeon]